MTKMSKNNIQRNSGKIAVLALAGKVLIFHAVAGMGLYFGFVTKPVFIARGWFRYG